MKLFIIATLISLALSSPLFFLSDVKDLISDAPPQSVSDYFTALFDAFKLDKPTQILDCFDGKSATLYFKRLSEASDLVSDTENRNHISAHLDILKLMFLEKSLQSLNGCMAATQDWSDLLEALGAKERNPELFGLAAYIYYQANYGKLAGELPPVIAAINSGDYSKAGTLKAGVLNTTANDIKKRGLSLLALKGLWNGVHLGLDLPDTQNVYDCWDNDSAALRIEFVYEMAKAVASGSANEAAYNVEKWYEKTGNDLLKKIPKKSYDCWKKSDDTQQESKKVGVDITSYAFFNQVNKFVHTEQGKFWRLQKAIKDNLEQHNFIHAGTAYASVLQNAANTK